LEGNWDTPAGEALNKLAKAIAARGFTLTAPIVVFGSGALQIFVDRNLLSGDVDISAGKQIDEVKKIVEEIGYGKNTAAFYIEVVPLYIFRAGNNWSGRARKVELHGVSFLFPEPIDILLGKLRRLEEKDLRAFDAVKSKLGRPTEDELIAELRDSWEVFEAQKDGTKSVLWKNTEAVWQHLFGKKIDIKKAILEPVFKEMESALRTPEYIEEMRTRFGL
jgi:hypothetical protein